MSKTKHEFIMRISGWMTRRDKDEPEGESEMATLDGLYLGKSQKIHRLIRMAYMRGVRRGVGLVWDSRQPISIRDAATEPTK